MEGFEKCDLASFNASFFESNNSSVWSQFTNMLAAGYFYFSIWNKLIINQVIYPLFRASIEKAHHIYWITIDFLYLSTDTNLDIIDQMIQTKCYNISDVNQSWEI